MFVDCSCLKYGVMLLKKKKIILKLFVDNEVSSS